MKKDDVINCRTMNSRFDLTGNEVTRVGKYYMVSRIAKIGNYGGGPGLKFLIRAFIVHYFGKPLGWLLVFFEDQIRIGLHWAKSIKQRIVE
ncbi:hypothetical protein QUF90_08105 [Desulfococcaceae bacterium HSG9]|nr:hypothetical protein [Desulfococcaceae bacterium HSG9]